MTYRTGLRRHHAEADREAVDLELGIALVAHELLGPLATLSAGHATLLSDPTLEGRTRQLVEQLHERTQQLSHVVTGLLGWAVEGRDLPRTAVDLVQVAHAAVASLVDATRERVELVASGEACMRGDPLTLRQAVANIVANALRYSQGAVTVSVEQAENTLALLVDDEGAGVPAREQERVFDPFVRCAHPDDPRGGAGLGLFITRRIVEAHAGTVRLEASAHGTRVRITLPRTNEGENR